MAENLVGLKLHVTDDESLEKKLRELEALAIASEDGCWGEYSAYTSDSSSRGLPNHIVQDRKKFDFSFMRVATKPLSSLGGEGAMHLDAATSSGVIDRDALASKAKLLRIVGNLHPTLPRIIALTFQPLEEMTVIEHSHGFRTCHEYDPEQVSLITLGPNKSGEIDAVMFDASTIPHMGVDKHGGHKVVAYHSLIMS